MDWFAIRTGAVDGAATCSTSCAPSATLLVAGWGAGVGCDEAVGDGRGGGGGALHRAFGNDSDVT